MLHRERPFPGYVTRRFIIYLVVLGASLVLISFQGGALPYMFCFAVILLIPASVFHVLIVCHSLRIYQTIEPHKTQRDQTAYYQLKLENAGLMPINRLVLRTDQVLARIDGIGAEESYTLMPGERISIRRDICCQYAGTYPAGALRMKITDCFGLIVYDLPLPDELRAIVCPPMTETAWKEVDQENIRFSSRTLAQTLQEPVAGNDLREYLPGDPRKRIAWRKSAAAGKLYVRLPDPQTMQEVSLILLAQAECESLEEIIRRDRFLEFAVSAVYYFVIRKKPVYVTYPRGEIRRLLVDSTISFQNFYEDLSDGLCYDREASSDQLLAAEKRARGRAGQGLIMTIHEKEFPDGHIITVEENL